MSSTFVFASTWCVQLATAPHLRPTLYWFLHPDLLSPTMSESKHGVSSWSLLQHIPVSNWPALPSPAVYVWPSRGVHAPDTGYSSGSRPSPPSPAVHVPSWCVQSTLPGYRLSETQCHSPCDPLSHPCRPLRRAVLIPSCYRLRRSPADPRAATLGRTTRACQFTFFFAECSRSCGVQFPVLSAFARFASVFMFSRELTT